MRAILIAMLIAMLPVNGAVEEISNLKIHVKINDSTHVRSEITIKNIVNNPIVPGVGEIRLQKVSSKKIWIIPIPFTEERSAISVKNVKAFTSDGRKIDTDVLYAEEYTVIQYQIWYPIEPQKVFTFYIEYDSPDLIDRGILFKSVTIPVGADVGIERLEMSVDSDWKLCYANPKMSSGEWTARIPANSIAFFTAEFSILPLPILPVRGYILFWGLILAFTIFIAILTWRKRPKIVPK